MTHGTTAVVGSLKYCHCIPSIMATHSLMLCVQFTHDRLNILWSEDMASRELGFPISLCTWRKFTVNSGISLSCIHPLNQPQSLNSTLSLTSNLDSVCVYIFSSNATYALVCMLRSVPLTANPAVNSKTHWNIFGLCCIYTMLGSRHTKFNTGTHSPFMCMSAA